MANDGLLIDLLVRSGFGDLSIYSHDGLIGPFDPIFDVHDDGNVGCMVGIRYVDGCDVDCGYFLPESISLSF